MRINDPEDRAIRMHSHAIASARDPKPAAKTVRQPCTAVWAESFSKIMGEGVCGKAGQMKPGQKYLPLRTDFANSSRRASRWDFGCWTEAVAILGGKCDVLTMDQRHEQWPLGTKVKCTLHRCDASGRMREPRVVTGKVVKHWLPEEYPYHCSVHFVVRDDPLGQLARHEVVPFYRLEKLADTRPPNNIADHAAFAMKANIAAHKVAELHRATPRKPGEFFVGDRVYVNKPGWGGLRFTLLRKMGSEWTASQDMPAAAGKDHPPSWVEDRYLRLLDEQPDVS